MFLYVGNEVGVDMQEQNSITISQDDLSLNENFETNIKVLMGACAETNTTTYYRDFDGDGLGSDITAEYCSGYEPDGWVTNSDDEDDYCYSNQHDDCGVCDGVNADQDCAGVCFGASALDDCGVCDGGNADQDCAGECGGSAVEDECGTCDSDTSNDCAQDCLGAWGGDAYPDNCNICDSDATNDCTQDCAGEWGGSAYVDNCSVCVGGTTGLEACVQDCAGGWGDSAYVDNCGACVGGTTGEEACVQDCAGVWGGNSYFDECGKCGVDNSTCTDDNTLNSYQLEDLNSSSSSFGETLSHNTFSGKVILYYFPLSDT